MNRTRFLTLTAVVVLAAACRLLPHPENVTPTAAVALFGAATFARRRAAVLVPLAALLASDSLLQASYLVGWQPRPGFYRGQWVVYGCTLATVGLGLLLRRRRTVAAVGSATLAGSLVFFLGTNFAWFHGEGSIYPRTPDGLLECYRMALPFFRNSLLGDAAFSAALFGTFALAEARFPTLRPAPRRAEAA